MTTMHFTLRPLKLTDATTIAQHINNKKIWDNVRDFLPFPYNEVNAANFINEVLELTPDTTFAIDIDGQAVGVISLMLKEDIYRLNGELGFWLGEPYWNKGITTEAVRQVVDIGFNKYQLHRIYAEVFETNTPSMKVLEKNGFAKEAVLKQAIVKNENILDLYILSKLTTGQELTGN